MNRILLIVIIFVLGAGVFLHKYYQPPLEPLYPVPYVAIYGREACGYTQQYTEEIANLSMHYYSKNVDDPATAALLHERMRRSGLDTGQYELPVLDVNGKLFIRPELNQALKAYRLPPIQPLKMKLSLNPARILSKLDFRRSKTHLVRKNNLPAYPQGEIRLEGISLGHPSVVVINGEILKKGETISGYTVLEIKASSVRLKNSQGEEIIKSLD